MIEYDFSNTYLSKDDLRIIKSAKNGIKMDDSLFKYIQSGFLNYKEYNVDDIGQLVPSDDILYQTEKSRAYFEYIKRTKAKTWIPVLISSLLSILALLISIFRT